MRHQCPVITRCGPTVDAALIFAPLIFMPLMIVDQERTFIAVKPDGVQRNLVGEIIKRLEVKGFKLVGLKMVTPHPRDGPGAIH